MTKQYYLLDTNIVSEPMKPFPNETVCKKLITAEERCAISSTTWDELLFGAIARAEGKKKKFILSKLIDDVQSTYPIINYDEHAAWVHADIRARLKERGTPVDFYDSQLAATAIANDMILVTRNSKHFEPIQEVSPLLVENWFEPEEPKTT